MTSSSFSTLPTPSKPPVDDISTMQFCFNVILKEARQEDRLVKQLCYTMLSAYTNNPINLAVNSPSGEGKSYVIHKVGDNFPKQDVMFLVGMTDKALFHRQGILVIKNPDNGEYESIEDKVAEIDSDISDKQGEIANSKDRNFKQARGNQIKELSKQKRDLLKDAKKLIDLSHKILVFLDTPRPELFSALMPLLSHDKYEIEYEFVDSSQHSGIKTRTNVLRGWPAVIFAQAIDYSRHPRYPEIQRRFIITNPKMKAEKYADAIDLTVDRFGLPDFMYQQKVVSDSDKLKAREIVGDIKNRMLYVCDRICPGKNSVFVPFHEALKPILSKEKALDMTIANRFGAFLTLLPLVNIDKRPMVVVRKEGDPIPRTIPFALFQDLRESVFLMEYADGVRPYILEWYYDVFLEAYNDKSKSGPDFKSIPARGNNKEDIIIEEKRIALTTQDLVDFTNNVSGKMYTKRQILDSYVDPLVNQGYIDSIQSELDKRSNIYYPIMIVEDSSKYKELGEKEQPPNLSQQSRIYIENPSLYPNKQYITSRIHALLRYAAQDTSFSQIRDHEETEITVDELAYRYYNNPEDYFTAPVVGALNSGNNEYNAIDQLQKRIFTNPAILISDELKAASTSYLQNDEIASELQQTSTNNIESTAEQSEDSSKLGEESKPPNLLYLCYYCGKGNGFQSNDETDYTRHVISKHGLGHPCYPCKADLERLGLKPQGKSWEI